MTTRSLLNLVVETLTVASLFGLLADKFRNYRVLRDIGAAGAVVSTITGSCYLVGYTTDFGPVELTAAALATLMMATRGYTWLFYRRPRPEEQPQAVATPVTVST